MRLSEAIRLGAMLRPQGFGRGFDGSGTCAWGAAFEAAGYIPKNELFDSTWMPRWGQHAFHAIFDVRRQCPQCSRKYDTEMVVHLNDEHRWTREQIADWIEILEREQEAKHVLSSTEANDSRTGASDIACDEPSRVAAV